MIPGLLSDTCITHQATLPGWGYGSICGSEVKLLLRTELSLGAAFFHLHLLLTVLTWPLLCPPISPIPYQDNLTAEESLILKPHGLKPVLQKLCVQIQSQVLTGKIRESTDNERLEDAFGPKHPLMKEDLSLGATVTRQGGLKLLICCHLQDMGGLRNSIGNKALT